MEDRLRICFVSFMFWPVVGGSEVQAEKQARQLQALGHEVTIVTYRNNRQWKPKETLDGLPVVRVGGIYRRDGRLSIGRLAHLPNTIAMALTLWRLRHTYDVIHAFYLSPPAALIGQLTRKPVILGIQSAGPSEAQRVQLEELGAALMTDTLAETSFLTVDEKGWVAGAGDIGQLPRLPLGKAMLDFLRKSNAFYQILSTRSHSILTSHGFRAEQIVHIPGSVDTEKFQPPPAGRLDPARPEREIICVARMEYAKGVDVLLHAWGRMLREPDEWRAHLKPRLRLVGEGTYRAQIELIAAGLDIQDSVEFLGLRTDVIGLLQQSWGFVMPSRWEGMPNALLEAMACGLPCVATRVSGSEDIITDAINGLLVEPEQPAEMAQALRRIIENAGLAQELGQAGRAAVVRNYQLPSIVGQCLDLYHRLLVGEKSVLPLAWEEKEIDEQPTYLHSY